MIKDRMKRKGLEPIGRLPNLGEEKSIERVNIVPKNVNIYSPRASLASKVDSYSKPKQTLKKTSSRLQLVPSQSRFIPKLEQQSPSEEVALKKALKFKTYIQTKAGCSVGGVAKVNQDNFIVEVFGEYNFFGVCDGHGTNGHLVSRYLKLNIPRVLGQYISSIPSGLEDRQLRLHNSFESAFTETNTRLFQQSFDTFFSGSTLVTVLITDKEIYCANVGDSRAVVIGFVNGKYEATPLSIDQKPSYGPERDRILKAGGRIDNQRDERGRPIGPLRVWLSKIRIPGLAMTRSFGDKAGTQAGMIASPVVLKHTLRQQDQVVIIASDGLWQFLQNEEVAQYIGPFIERNQLKKGVKGLLQLAEGSWAKNSTVRDDITIQIVQLRQ